MPEPTATLSNRYVRHLPALANGTTVVNGEWFDTAVYVKAHFQVTGAALVGADQIDIEGSNEATRPADATSDTVLHSFFGAADDVFDIEVLPRWMKVRRSNNAGGANSGVSVVMRRQGGSR